MTITARDRRALLILAAAAAVLVLWRLALTSGGDTVEVSDDSPGSVEKQLVRLRQTAATLPHKEVQARQSAEALALREKGLLQAETAEQAQAQLLQIARRLTKEDKIEIRSTELGPIRPLGADYGEVSAAVSFECAIEQLINFMAALSKEAELLAPGEVQVIPTGTKHKTLNVRFVLAGVVARRLVPERKGLGAL